MCDRLSETWKTSSSKLRSQLTLAQNDLSEFRRLSSVCDQASKLGLEAAAEKMDAEIADLVKRKNTTCDDIDGLSIHFGTQIFSIRNFHVNSLARIECHETSLDDGATL